VSWSPPRVGVSPRWPCPHPDPARNRGACVRYRGAFPACWGAAPHADRAPGLCSRLRRKPPDPLPSPSGNPRQGVGGDIELIVPSVSPQPGAAEGKGGGKANMLRGRNSAAAADEQPHIGNYRLLKTIGKGNFAKVKLARHVLTGKEVGATAARGRGWSRGGHRGAGTGSRLSPCGYHHGMGRSSWFSSRGCHHGVGLGFWSSPCGCYRGDKLVVLVLWVPPWCGEGFLILTLWVPPRRGEGLMVLTLWVPPWRGEGLVVLTLWVLPWG